MVSPFQIGIGGPTYRAYSWGIIQPYCLWLNTTYEKEKHHFIFPLTESFTSPYLSSIRAIGFQEKYDEKDRHSQGRKVYDA